MTEPVVVRAAVPSDCQVLVDFNIALAWETEGKRLERDIVARGVQHLLEQPDAGFYRLAQIDGQVAGSLMITFEWSDWRDGFFWWIQSVYVHPDFRRRGVFRRLYQHVVQEAQSRDRVRGVRLYVEHENHAAQQTYRALGMVATRYHLYEHTFR